MSWQALIVVRNNTEYNITVANASGEIANILPSQRYNYSMTDPTLAMTLKLWQQPNVFYLQGVLNISPETGVYIDRGNLPEDSQNIRLRADVNGTDYLQETNIGSKVIEYNNFPNGATINLRYENGA